ncbi:MAG: IclR family transcriptional regulator [Azospirillaceae bacterium]
MTRKTASQDSAWTDRTRALDRGLQILEEVAGRSSMTLAEISAACGLSPSTATRILRTLELRGFLIRDPDNKAYRIGLKSFEIGSKFLSETRLQETCRLILRKLTAASGQSTTLAILNRADVVYVEAHEATAPLRSTPLIGMRTPAHATASGKCLLAAQWAEGLLEAIGPGPYVGLTERTITAFDALKQELIAVRKNGIAFDHEELHADISSMACPVYDRSGEVIAALAIHALTSQMTSHSDDWSILLRSAAAESSLRLGWRDRYQDAQVKASSLLID